VESLPRTSTHSRRRLLAQRPGSEQLQMRRMGRLGRWAAVWRTLGVSEGGSRTHPASPRSHERLTAVMLRLSWKPAVCLVPEHPSAMPPGEMALAQDRPSASARVEL